jgi:hypothetical protein
MEEELKDVMKENVLKVCEKYSVKNIDVNVDFVYDLIEAVVKSTPNTIDDGIFAVFDAQTKDRLKGILYEYADKIDGVEGNVEETK